MREAVKNLNKLTKINTEELAHKLFHSVPLSAFNHVLFRCNEEERDISNGTRGPYGLQVYGEFEYAGLTSVIHILRQLKISGDMGHELFNNMRSGNWLLEYTVERLNFMKSDLNEAISFLHYYFDQVKPLNNTFKPKYAAKVFEKLYNAACTELLNRRMIDDFISGNEDLFLQRLAIAAV